jgi:protein gp37
LKLRKLFTMSLSNLSYKELAIPYFKEVFEVIDQTMIAHQIAYYLIGVKFMLVKKVGKSNYAPPTLQ